MPRARNAVDTAVILAFAVLFASYGQRFYADFPGSYSWSELLINYQGGFVRRGLLGELSFDLDGLVPARSLLTGVVVGCHGLCALLAVLLSRRAGTLAALALLLSPAGLLFPIYDRQAFGRKDVFILLALLASARLCAGSRVRGRLPVILALYAVLGFVVETAWFYLPVAVALHAWRAGRDGSLRRHAAVWSATALVLAGCLAVTVAANRAVRDPAAATEQRRAIAASWDRLAPGAAWDEGALLYLGMSPGEGVEMALRGQGSRSTALGYAFGFLFAILPTVVLRLRSRPVETAAPARAMAAAAFAAMSATFLVGADWGRYIHLWTAHAFVFSLLTRDACRRAPATDRQALSVAAAALLIYASTWRLKHYAWDGTSAFVPGAVFLLVRATPP